MEAYCKAVRALEDKFYGIELNHVPCRYNEEADELAKIASGRITTPRTFLRGTSPSRPSTSSCVPRDTKNPRGLPRVQQARAYGQGPLERGVCALPARRVRRRRGRGHGYGATPSEGDWRDKYIAWMDRGELPSDRSEARCIARMAKSFALVDGELYKRAASGVLQRCVPIPQGASSFGTYTRACAATTQRHVPSWATHSARASTGPPRWPTPARSCTPAKGASFTPASPTSLRTSCRPSTLPESHALHALTAGKRPGH
jgi:hypothetical protein